MIATKGLVHFTIPVKDLDVSEKFYTELMGLEVVRRNPHMVFIRARGEHDNYFVLTLSEKPIDPNPGKQHDIHTAFLVDADEYDRAKQELVDNGVEIIKEDNRDSGTFQGRAAYFHDPDRNVLEIIDLVKVGV